MTIPGPVGFGDRARAAAARALAGIWYAATLALARLAPRPARRRSPSGRAVVIGTFHNPGWYLSHATPLARSGLRDIIVVSHGLLPRVEGVRCEPPPPWLTALAGRTVSKFLWALRIGRRYDADVFIGYHIIPNGTIALAAARLLRRRACYQMTGGPVELLGGGYLATENQVLGRLRRPSPRLERLALAVASEFDLVVVRGRSAARFLAERTNAPKVAIIPGSVDLARFPASISERRCDLVFVGRLAPTKQPLQFIDIVAAVRRRLPAVRACIVGDGPLMDAMRRRIVELGLEQAIDVRGQVNDAFPFLSDARVFVLTSRSEGLSIAMVEAMISGTVPVVANVGDLADVVSDGENGFLIEPGNIEQYAERAIAILTDEARRQALSAAAARSARAYNGLDRVSALWARHLGALAEAGGNASGEPLADAGLRTAGQPVAAPSEDARP